MRQKLTWIIPGILVTLLLGLLWAIPAFGAEAGTIQFKDEKGGDAITHVSLNGDAAGNDGFWIQITDADLDPIIKRVGDNADTGLATDDLGGVDGNDRDIGGNDVPPVAGESWYDLEDMNGDGRINSRDVKAFATNGNELTTGIAVNTDGTLDTPDATAKLEYWIKKQTSIGARAGTDRTATIEVDVGTVGENVEIGDDTSPDLDTRVDDADGTDAYKGPSVGFIDGTDDDLSWHELLSSKIPGLLTDKYDTTAKENALKTQVEALISAHNEGETAALKDTATISFERDSSDANYQKVTEISVTIGSVCPPAAAGATGCTARTGAIGPWSLNDANNGWVNPADASEDVNIVINITTSGSAENVYPGGQLGSAAENGRVVISSQGAKEDISVMLTETGAATGAFGTTIKICPASSDSTSTCGETPSQSETSTTDTGMVTLPVDAAGDTITITYKDSSPGATRTATIPLDPSGPSFSNMSPASGTSGREDEPTVSFEVIDGESGISDSDKDLRSVFVVAKLYNINGSAMAKNAGPNELVIERNKVDLDAVTDGYAASVDIQEGERDDELDAGSASEYEIRWWAVATDKAGNTGASDEDSKTECKPESLNEAQAAGELVTALTGADCDAFVIRVDAKAPTLNSAATGVWHDGDNEQPYTGTDDKVNKKSPKRTSVVARFSEALDCDSVSADDFTVAGSAPNGATCKGSDVYLDVDELDANATPSVMVATGSVTDKAGNAIAGNDASRTETATDGIPAMLSVTVTGTGEGDRPVTKKDVTITVTSDERLSGRPKVTISKVTDDYGLTVRADASELNPTGTTNEWSGKFTYDSDSDDGLYNVRITATDRGADMEATAGASSLTKDKLKTSNAILFEVDREVQTPEWPAGTKDKTLNTDNPDVFITANFADEGKEYGLGVDDKGTKDDTSDDTMPATETPSEVVTDFDSHGGVTLMEAMFNDDDVTADVASRDDSLYVYRPGGLSVGEHKLSLKVSDNAGNEGTFDITVNVTERQAFKLAINPGANLVSFPGAPVDGGVDAVFGGDSGITTVVTYNNASGLWMTATRSGSGSFSGDLTMVDGNHAYWAVSNGAADLSVVLVRSGGISTTPAAIPVVEGWNLVPVSDAQQRKEGTGIDAKDYFGNIDADVAYGYDSITGVMQRLDVSSATDKVMVGKGYWVYANKAGVIIP